MLAQTLGLVEGEQRDSPCRPANQRPTDNCVGLVVDKAGQGLCALKLGVRHFAMTSLVSA